MQSADAHVLYIKSSSSWLVLESLTVLEDFLAVFYFLAFRVDFLGLLMASFLVGILKIKQVSYTVVQGD